MRLDAARHEQIEHVEEDIVECTEWMELCCITPNIKNKFQDLMNTNYNWLQSRENYNCDELNEMIGWIDKQKVLYKDNNDSESKTIPDVNPDQLNRLQRFTYEIIKEFKIKQEQLLMILLGTAGTGKSFTVAAITKLYYR